MSIPVKDDRDSFEISKQLAKALDIDIEDVSKIQINITATGLFTVVVERYITYPQYTQLLTEVLKYKFTRRKQ